MCLYLERGIETAGIAKEFGALKGLVLCEQFLRKCKFDMRMFVKERIPKPLKEIISLTEQYLAGHGGPMWVTGKIHRVKTETSAVNTTWQEKPLFCEVQD